MSGRRKDFWSLVDKSETCWRWTGAHSTKGYGVFRRQYAHRVAYALTNGPISDGVQVDHRCHVLDCVAPNHLRAVTNQQNAENRQGAYSTSRSGVRGVSWHRRAGKWIVQVTSRGENHYGGLFVSQAEAEAVAVELRNRLMTHNDIDRKVAR